MTDTNLSIPTDFCEPRCFVLEPIINHAQALTQAGEQKGKVFGFGVDKLLRFVGQRKTSVDAKLLQRRLVPFWHVRCSSHFDYSRLNDYQINAHDPDAVQITIQGSKGQTINFRVDQTGRSEGRVTFTGVERCNTNRDLTEWIDSYVQRGELPLAEALKEQRRMEESAKQNPRQVYDLESFVKHLSLDGQPLFVDGVETIVVPPLETADMVVKRTLRKVMVSIDASTIHEWGLRVEKIDLYFRPLFVFQFEKLDERGNPLERKLEELDALNRSHWTNLASTEFQMSNIPWNQILKLSANIGVILLQDIPVLGRSLEISKAISEQGPDIINSMRG